MGTIPTIPSFSAGAVLTAAQMNNVKAVSDFWALTPRCSVYQSAPQSIPNSTVTAIAFDVEVYDIVQSGDSPSHDNTTNNTRVYIRTTGKYEISGQVYYASNATGVRLADIRLNAAGSGAGGTRLVLNQNSPLSGVGTPVACVPIEASLTAGDYVEIFGQQTSGGALNTAGGLGLTFLRIRLTGS